MSIQSARPPGGAWTGFDDETAAQLAGLAADDFARARVQGWGTPIPPLFGEPGLWDGMALLAVRASVDVARLGEPADLAGAFVGALLEMSKPPAYIDIRSIANDTEAWFALPSGARYELHVTASEIVARVDAWRAARGILPGDEPWL